MAWFKPGDLLDRTFEVGIILKGLDGLLELIGGVLLLAVSRTALDHLVVTLTQHELSGDPHDYIATHLLHLTAGLDQSALRFGAVYLLLHGAVKVVLVVALLRNQLWAYPWTIVFLLAFIGYQIYRFALHPTIGLALLTIFDAFIVWLTWREYGRQRAGRDHSSAPA